MTDVRPGAEYFGKARTTPPPGPTPPPPFRRPNWTANPSPAAPAAPATAGGLLDRAKHDDQDALKTLFGQFIPPGEPVDEAHYLGVMGILGFGTHSFAALTSHRVATLRIGLFGEVLYQDAPLEYLNSTAILQPSRLKLYAWPVIWVLGVLFLTVTIMSAGGTAAALVGLLIAVLGLVATPLVVKLSYRFVKSGLLLWVREGLAVFVFMDRQRITLANRYYRLCSEMRDERIRAVGNP